MRKAVFAALVLFTAASVFAASPSPTCNQPNLLISGIQGEMQPPCAGAIEFSSASFSVPSTTGSNANGSGAGAGTSGPGTLRITRYFDSSSPALMTACVTGKHFQKATLSYPSAQQPVAITFEDVFISFFNDSYNPTSESVEFKYTKFMIQSGNTKVTGSVMGGMRATSMTASVIGSDGKSQPVSHASLTVRPGSTTFDSVQLAPPPPGNVATRAGIVKSTPQGDRPAESMSLNFGKITFTNGRGAAASFNFNGGTLVNGNLRVSRASYTGATTVAAHP
jgi:type VI secretion system secreted protein Hcp